MIKRIENNNEFASYDKTDIFSIRILSLLNAYGTGYDFAKFFIQTNNDGEATSIISALDGDYTLSHKENYDSQELTEFFSALGYASVISDDGYKLNDSFTEGDIMETASKKELHISYAEIDEFPKLMDIFNLDDYNDTDFENWYVDASHRIRHNCAKATALRVNGEIVSSAILSSIYKDDAILTAVRTAPEFRGLGYGSTLVSEMICDVKGKVYLMREAGRNEHFYKRLGFINNGKWRLFK